MADERILSRLVVVGASHRTSSEATRDRLFISEDDLPGFLKKISVAGFSEAVAMSTCARTEIFGLADNIGAARLGAIGVLSDLGGLDADSLAGETYSHAARARFDTCFGSPHRWTARLSVSRRSRDSFATRSGSRRRMITSAAD